MESSVNEISTPGPNDNLASTTTQGTNMDFGKDSSPGRPACPDTSSDRPLENSREKQSESKRYEFGTFERVLWCDGLNLTIMESFSEFIKNLDL